MDSNIFYNRMNLSADDIQRVYTDVEKVIRDHIKDWHSADSAFVLDSHKYEIVDSETNEREVASDLRVHQPLPQGDVNITINPGVAFINSERIEVPEQITYTVTDIPNSGPESSFVRIDLLYITKVQNDTVSRSREFIDTNKNVYQQTVKVRRIDGYEIGILRGDTNTTTGIDLNNAEQWKPDPNSEANIGLNGKVVPLAYIWLKPLTDRIINSYGDMARVGFIEDTRTRVTPFGHKEV